ncbi:MAG: TIR domain-containing protein [Lachnospiraceae bacterium]|nr:TIR domain-containing protein [Lachnospiraceae bacterium]
MIDIFISHSSNDSEIAKEVCRFLESKGFSCWLDSRDIPKGSEWEEEIIKAIIDAKIFLLIYSNNFANSKNLRRELSNASKHDKMMIPYNIDNAEPNYTCDYYFTNIQWIHADYAGGERQFGLLYTAVCEKLGIDIVDASDSFVPENMSKAGEDSEIEHEIKSEIESETEHENSRTYEIHDCSVTYHGLTYTGIFRGEQTSMEMASGKARFEGQVGEANGKVRFEGQTGEANGKGRFEGSAGLEDGVYELEADGYFLNGFVHGNVNASISLRNPDGLVFFINAPFINGYENGAGSIKKIYPENYQDSSYIEEILIEGIFKNGEIEGQAREVQKTRSGNVYSYEGSFSKGTRNGRGTQESVFTEGKVAKIIYEGTWKEGDRDGKGLETWYYRNGDIKVYKGSFTINQWDGYGTLTVTYAEGDITEYRYEGEWKTGIQNGRGKDFRKYRDGRKTSFVGSFIDGKWIGNGAYTTIFSEGNEVVFEGCWEDGRLSGEAKQTLKNINGNMIVYEGLLSGWKRNGQGKMIVTLAEGDIRKIIKEGLWKNGELISGKVSKYDINDNFVDSIDIETGTTNDEAGTVNDEPGMTNDEPGSTNDATEITNDEAGDNTRKTEGFREYITEDELPEGLKSSYHSDEWIKELADKLLSKLKKENITISDDATEEYVHLFIRAAKRGIITEENVAGANEFIEYMKMAFEFQLLKQDNTGIHNVIHSEQLYDVAEELGIGS